MRLIGFLFLALAAVLAFLDWRATGFEGYALREIGFVWDELHRQSLLFMNNLVSRHISTGMFESVWNPFLLLPAVPVAGGIGAVLFLLGGRRRQRG